MFEQTSVSEIKCPRLRLSRAGFGAKRERFGGLKPTLPLLKEIIKEFWAGAKKNSKIKIQKSKM
jgi:hypothetical protein